MKEKTRKSEQSIKVRTDTYGIFWEIMKKRSKPGERVYMRDLMHEAALLLKKQK